MKKYILLLISILLFSILISCSKENDINNKEHTEIKEKKTVVYCIKRVTSSLSSPPGGFKNFQWQAYVKA